MCSTISQNAARSCCAPERFRQRHGGAVALAAQGRRDWPCAVALETIFVAVRLSCDCPSEPPSASRDGQSVKSAICRASRRGFRGISSPGKRPPGSGIPRPRNPVCHASLQPPERPALATLFEAAPKGRTSRKRRTTMATKTTSTTDNSAGCSPCTPEAHQRSVFHNQMMMEDIGMEVIPDEFDLEEAIRRLAIYIREHAVPMTHSPGA